MGKEKSFKEMSPPQQVATIASIVLSLAVVTAAQRDLHRRPDDDVRGDKRLWRLLCLNALGALAYFRWGRRAAAA